MKTLWGYYQDWIEEFCEEFYRSSGMSVDSITTDGIQEVFEEYYGVPSSTKDAFLLQYDPKELGHRFAQDYLHRANRGVLMFPRKNYYPPFRVEEDR